LPDIKINTDAMSRTTQLVQQRFMKVNSLSRQSAKWG